MSTIVSASHAFPAAPLRPAGVSPRPLVASNHVRRKAAVSGTAWLRLLAVTLLLTAGLVLSGFVGSSIADEPGPAPLSVVVQPGDTVWALAQQHAPAGTSVQDYALVVVTHNGVSATALRPGTVLELPQ